MSLALFLLTSCEKELYEDAIQNSSRNLTVQHIKLKDIDKAISTKIESKISTIKKTKGLKEKLNGIENRFEYNSNLDIYIDTENGELINNNGDISYTFPMFRRSEEKLENIVFKQKQDGTLDTFFAKYNIKPEEFTNLTLNEKSNLKPDLYRIYFQGFDLIIQYVCTNIYYTITTYGTCPYPNGYHPGSGLQCDAEVTAYSLSFCNVTTTDGGGNSDGSNGNSTGNTGNTGNSGDNIGDGIGTGSNDVSTTPTTMSESAIKIKKFKMQLTDSQENCFNGLPTNVKNELDDFIAYTILPLEDGTPTTTAEDQIQQEAEDMMAQMCDNPGVFSSITPFIIEKKIDDSQLDPCSKGVFQQIKNTTNCDFANVLAKLNANGSIYNTTMKTEHNSIMVGGILTEVTDPANTKRTTQDVKYDYTIYVNPDYSDKTKLYIATLLLHEVAHAYFFALLDDLNSGTTNSFYELPILYNAFQTHSSNFNAALTHEEIANSYVNAIAAALKEFQPGLSQQVYDDMAWSGLEETTIFNTIHPPGSASRQRITNRKAAEQSGHPIEQGTPQEQINYGQPCN